MNRLTISLSDERYRALKEAAAQRGSTIGNLVDAALEYYGIKSRERAIDLVRRVRADSMLASDDALALSLREQHAVRGRTRTQ